MLYFLCITGPAFQLNILVILVILVIIFIILLFIICHVKSSKKRGQYSFINAQNNSHLLVPLTSKSNGMQA